RGPTPDSLRVRRSVRHTAQQLCGSRSLCRLRNADTLDFPFECNAGFRPYPRANLLAQRLDICGRCVTPVDEEVAVRVGDLRAAVLQSPATRFVDQLPGFVTGWILESGTARPGADRLGGFTLGDKLVHACADLIGLSGAPFEHRFDEDETVWHRAFAIG